MKYQKLNFDNIIQIVNKIYKLDNLKEFLILAGGLVPYVVLKQKSNRLHSDIDFICEFDYMSDVRNIFKRNNYYDEDLDSLKDNQIDYGFEMIIDGIKVGIYPFKKDNNKTKQYSYDSESKEYKIKCINLDINRYTCKCDNIKVMSLEIILKSKIIAFREIDKYDIDAICKYGFDNSIYSKLEIDVIANAT